MNDFNIGLAFASWHGGIIMSILIAISIYLMALMFIRFSFFRKISADPAQVLKKAQDAIMKKDNDAIESLKGQRPSDPPLNILVSAGLTNAHLSAHELEEVFHITRTRQGQRLGRGLSIFGTIATVAPFLGLLGTVLGIVESFNSLAETGMAGPNVVGRGVAEALWATAAGLVVAIPAVVAYNVLKGKARNIMIDMEVMSRELILLFKSDPKVKLKLSA